MSQQKKFGTFAGVFTPSLLTILGVIMYLRMGWVVGNAGLFGVIGIIIVAHIISITTGLSVSSISTDKKVGAGGVYYVLSRSLGLPMGGALGIALFVATAFSIALYMVGFAEIFNQFISQNYFEFGYYVNDSGELVQNPATFANSLRITGSLGLLALTILAFISTSIALKSQFVILGLIILSLVAIFMGDTSNVSTISFSGGEDKASMIEIFAIFFPAVTGFTAGIAMSGDLKDSKKSIPYGTMLSIAVGFAVYMALALFLHYNFTDKTLAENGELLYQITIYGGIFVFLGVWGATLSSALGGILGGPRILQAMSVDKITPKFFAKGVGKGNEPQRALILTVLIAEAGILIGDLNVIAEVVSMFYLSAYGFINISFFLESWASADFNPTFKVKKWVGLFGFIATFTVMFQLNMLAMVAAFVIIGGIYFYLNKKQVALGTGDIWQSVWSTIVKKGLRKMEAGNDHKRNWKPNLLLFSGGSETRPKLIEFSKAISGQAGIITNFDLIENKDAKILFPKNKQIVQDEELEKFGIFGRQIEVQNEFKGIESLATTFGFSGIEPNTTLMPWPGETKDPIWFTEMTKKLIDLDYNVLYLDYDKRWGFRKKEKIGLWWRSVGNNAELMLSLVKFIKTSSDWVRANTRILLVNETNVDNALIEKRIQAVLDQFRIQAEIKIINNAVDKKPIYELMKIHSAEADLVFVGIPEIEENNIQSFVDNTNTLVNTIGTTLLVKASSQFEETDLKIEQINLRDTKNDLKKVELIHLADCKNESLGKEIQNIDKALDGISHTFVNQSIQKIEDFHHNLISKNTQKLDEFLDAITNAEKFDIDKALDKVLKEVRDNHDDACNYQLPIVHELFEEQLDLFNAKRDEIFIKSTSKIEIINRLDENGNPITKKGKIKFNVNIERAWINRGLNDFKHVLLEFGYQNFILLHQSKNIIHKAIWIFIEETDMTDDIASCALKCKNQIDNALKEIDKHSLNLAEEFYKLSRNVDRNLLNDLSACFEKTAYKKEIQNSFPVLKAKKLKEINQFISHYPHYWKRNTILFSYHLQADLYLLQFSTRVDLATTQLINHNQKGHIASLNNSISSIEKDISNLSELIDSNNVTEINTYYFSFNEDIFFNPDVMMSSLIEQIHQAIDKLPEEVELMNAVSLNAIREEQNDNVKTIKIQLDDITDFITKAHFIKPVKDQMSFYFDQLKRVMGVLLNSSFHINNNLENFAKTNKLSDLKKSIDYAKDEVIEAKALLTSVNQAFLADLNLFKDSLNTELEINKIIGQYDNLNKNVSLKNKSKLFRKLKEIRKQSSDSIQKLTAKILQKKHDAGNVYYQEKFKNVLSKQGVYRDFIDTISLTHSVSEQLPFYYQQLFSGKHITDNQTITNRQTEVNKIKTAIERIDNGTNAGIILLGETLSGKSFLANHVCNHLLDGKVYRIKTKLNQSTDKSELTRAFQTTTGIKENINKILNKVNGKSVFLFEDIEQWWLKTENGSVILDEISRLIEKFGTRHYFILTANIYAFQALNPTSTLSDNLISTVILNPLNAKDLIDVLKSRHKIGGLELVYKDVESKFMSESKMEKMYLKYYSTSNGNIGLALRQWLANIDLIDENKIYVNLIEQFEFPELTDETWKNILYQFHTHKNLSRIELYSIYGETNKAWINRIISSLLKAELIKTVEKNTFEINPEVKPYLEQYLYA